MKKSININGISTTAAYTDGDCIKLVNLRKKNGVLRPVTPRKVTRTTAEQYVYTFQHNLPNTGKNLIGIRNNELYHVVVVPGQPDTETKLTEVSGFKSITQIGNLLQVLDATGIKILFWVDTEYKLIESNFGGAQTATELLPVKVDLRVDGMTNGSGVRLVRRYYGETTTDKENAKEQIYGLFPKALGNETAQGKITGCFMCCYAVELYDGSYILHSQPVLMGNPWDVGTRYHFDGYGDSGTVSGLFDYITNPCGWSTSPTAQSSDLLTTPTNPNTEYDYEEIANNTMWAVNSDGIVSADPLNYPFIFGMFKRNASNDTRRPYVSISSNELKFKINSNIDEKLKPLVKSISIFCSRQINILKDNVAKSEDMLSKHITFSYTGNDWLFQENHFYPYKSTADILKELSDNQRFYKVHEITFDELRTLSPGTWIDINLKDKIGDNLVNQEALPVDNFTHHSYKPNKQLVYNSKLHIMDYGQELFRPWPSLYNFAQQGIGQFSSETYTPASDWEQWIIVTIKTDTGISKVVRHNSFSNTVKKANKDLILSYPDSRANKIEIITKINIHGGDLYSKSEYTLTPSTHHNFSYWISDTLKPVATAISYTFQEPFEIDRTLIYRNAMKVSSVNNPFYFPAETTYTIGTGTILNAGTNAQRMSEGQFGQYDLYVLTTEGMYSLDTGTEISYNRQSPASLEIPISDILCSIPYGVLFIGKRGLYMITGQETQFISAQIEENGATNSIVAEGTSFSTFVSNLKDILYDNRENEIILVSNTLDYNYVYNIDSKMWYISTEKIDYEIKNSSPNLLVSEGKKIKDYSQQETDKAAVTIITRPLFFGIDEVKKLERSYLRGKFYSLTSLSPFYSIYGSNDGVQQLLLRGFTIPATKQNRTYKDFDSGIIARSTYRNYTIAFEATVGEQTEISHVDFEVTDNYSNDKLR